MIYLNMGLLWKCVIQRPYCIYKHGRNFLMNVKLNAFFHNFNSIYYPYSSLYSSLKNRQLINQKLSFSSGNHLYRESSFDDVDDEVKDADAEQYEDMVKRVFHLPEMGHQVLVIQPYVKWGVSKKRNTNPDLQLSEAVALVGTLKNWKVVDKVKIALNSLEKKTLFGSGNLESLTKQIQKNKQVTAVFISTDLLRGVQLRELEDKFGVPVYDRYMLVIQIFREHAVSREVKLQVAMAEILYLRMRIRGLSDVISEHHGARVAAIGGAGETSLEIRKRILNNREAQLKNKLHKLRNQRALLRNRRKKLEYPVVAVVGYTNAGKTSLIKALTGEQDMIPKDHLFATLDVTAHAGLLPCQLKVLYVDTVGFISDIPTNLIESFMATLEDALQADVVIHVCDVSHPDYVAQGETVKKMLETLKLKSDLLDSILVVGNKVDLLTENSTLENMKCNLLVSAVTQQGLRELLEQIEELVLRATNRVSVTFRVIMGGEEMNWLSKHAAVTEMATDPESSQHVFMNVVMTEAQMSKFRHMFIKK